MTFWSEIFLGVIAVATLTMAVIQVAAIVYGVLLARRVGQIVSQVEQEVKPLTASLNAIARDAARVSALASGQAERADRLLSDLSTRMDETAAAIQDAVLRPLRDGAALLTGIKAVIDTFREPPRQAADQGRRPADEDEQQFIG